MVVLVLAVASPGPAAAGDECIKANVWITWSGGPDQYVTPWPTGSCVVPTPGMAELTHPYVGHEFDELPADPNIPSGAQADLVLTSP